MYILYTVNTLKPLLYQIYLVHNAINVYTYNSCVLCTLTIQKICNGILGVHTNSELVSLHNACTILHVGTYLRIHVDDFTISLVFK